MTQPIIISICVLGAFNSGKTALIRAISEMDAVSAEFPKDAPVGQITIALDFGRLTLADTGIAIYFWGEPGARRIVDIATLLPPLWCERVSILYVVDSAKYVTDYHTKQPITETDEIYREDMLHYGWAHEQGYPHIVATTKQDHPHARSPEELRKVLAVAPDIPVLPVSAKTDPASIRNAVYTLLERLPQDEIIKTALANFPL